MQNTAAKTATSKKQASAHAGDPRFAAFARLLARHAARRDFEKELKRSQPEAYPADSAPEDAS
jgi:hypothetical protein